MKVAFESKFLDDDEDVTPCSCGADENDREFLLEFFVSFLLFLLLLLWKAKS